MKQADQVLADDQIVSAVYEALVKRHPKSRTRGRLGTPAEVVRRLLIRKHVRNWSYGVLEREVRANLVYRDFTRVGAEKVPDAKAMGRWGLALGAGGHPTDTRKDGANSSGQTDRRRPQNARGHNGG
jgi:transposase, IS5 family